MSQDTAVKKVRKRIAVREEVCIGCRLCEVYCTLHHSKSRSLVYAFKSEFPKPQPGLVVEENGPVSFAVQCRHCPDAPCVQACMTGAMHKDPVTGNVKNDPEQCIGCWMCVMVCPYGAIRRDVENHRVLSKCDHCEDEEMPLCVKMCPNEALSVVEEEL